MLAVQCSAMLNIAIWCVRHAHGSQQHLGLLLLMENWRCVSCLGLGDLGDGDGLVILSRFHFDCALHQNCCKLWAAIIQSILKWQNAGSVCSGVLASSGAGEGQRFMKSIVNIGTESVCSISCNDWILFSLCWWLLQRYSSFCISKVTFPTCHSLFAFYNRKDIWKEILF